MALILFPRAGDSVDPSVVQAGTDQGALEGALLAYPSLGATFGAYLMGTFFGLMYEPVRKPLWVSRSAARVMHQALLITPWALLVTARLE